MNETKSLHQTALLRFTGHINLCHTATEAHPPPHPSHCYTAKVHCTDDTQYPQQWTTIKCLLK